MSGTVANKSHIVDLFSGKPGFLGGLSNERELFDQCPKQFREGWAYDAWCEAASSVFFAGAYPGNWKWKSQNKQEQSDQIACFYAALSGMNLMHEHKIALCGWMLSEMLTEVPS